MLGVLFILVVFFVPGGLARIGRVRRPRTLQRLAGGDAAMKIALGVARVAARRCS